MSSETLLVLNSTLKGERHSSRSDKGGGSGGGPRGRGAGRGSEGGGPSCSVGHSGTAGGTEPSGGGGGSSAGAHGGGPDGRHGMGVGDMGGHCGPGNPRAGTGSTSNKVGPPEHGAGGEATGPSRATGDTTSKGIG